MNTTAAMSRSRGTSSAANDAIEVTRKAAPMTIPITRIDAKRRIVLATRPRRGAPANVAAIPSSSDANSRVAPQIVPTSPTSDTDGAAVVRAPTTSSSTPPSCGAQPMRSSTNDAWLAGSVTKKPTRPPARIASGTRAKSVL